MKRYEVKDVKADYSGGGIYLFRGKLTDGNFFLADCDCGCSLYSLRIVNENPDDYEYEEALYEDWQMKYFVEDVSRCKRFIKDMLKWIVKNKPEGNYLLCEIEEMLRRL